MSAYDPGYLQELLAAPFKPLSKTLTKERAVELVGELGFLGICDLVYLMASVMEGSLECKGNRVTVKIARKPRVKKTPSGKEKPPAKKASGPSRG